MLYKSGYYCCVETTGTGISSKVCDAAIHAFTRSKYAHAFIVTNAEKGEIVEATPHAGVHYSNISKYKDCKKVFSSTDLSDMQRGIIVQTARSQVGRYSYGFLNIAYLGLYTQGIEWNWLESEVLEEHNQTICSQAVAFCGAAAGVPSWLCGKSHPNLVWPGNLANLALGNNPQKTHQ